MAWILALLGLVLVYGAVVFIKFRFLRWRGKRRLAAALEARPSRRPIAGEPRLTFVSPVTKPHVLATWLEAGLDDLDDPHARILYPNTGEGAMVAARLFNHLAQEVKTPYVAFVHQDWRPIDRDWVSRTIAVFEETGCEMVVQVGIGEDKSQLVGEILDAFGGGGLRGVHRVHAPDEQCFVLRTEALRAHPFDEEALPEFHFYAVDYAQEVLRRGGSVYTNGALAYHDSAIGDLRHPTFQKAKEIMRRKWGEKAIRATTGWV
ncbi:hypothetical protein D3C87_1005510 [compost metagenome]